MCDGTGYGWAVVPNREILRMNPGRDSLLQNTTHALQTPTCVASMRGHRALRSPAGAVHRASTVPLVLWYEVRAV